MSNEMKEAAAVTLWDRLRADHGRIFMWVLVWLFTMSSVVVNGAHALDAMGDGATAWMRAFAVAVAGFFPFAGLVMTEAVLIMIRSWRTGRWWVTAMQGLLVTASGVMLIVAFWRSFNALTEMAVRLAMPASDAWMLPVLTDTGIVVGTLGVVLAEVKMKLDGDAAVIDVDALGPAAGGRVDQSVQPLDDRPVERADESVESVPDEPGEQSVELDPARSTEPVESDSTGPDLEDSPVEFSPVEVSGSVGPTAAQSVESYSTELSEPVGPERVDRSSSIGPAGLEVPDQSVDLVEPVQAWAGRVCAETSISAGPDELAQVLALDQAGRSRQQIAAEIGRSKSTVTGWIKTAGGVERLRLVPTGERSVSNG